MSAPLLRRGLAAALLVVAAGWPAVEPAVAQDQAAVPEPRRIERFAGELRLDGGAREIAVTIEKWIVSGPSRVELPRLERGLVLVELMAGALYTTDETGRSARTEGDRWTLSPGRPMTLEVTDDTAVLTLVIMRER